MPLYVMIESLKIWCLKKLVHQSKMRILLQCVAHKPVGLVVVSETNTLATIYILQILPSVKNKSITFNK